MISFGNWILGFNRYLDRCTSFEVKLWGVLDGLLVLLNKGFKRGTIQIDNSEVIQALTNNGMEDSGITMLKKVQRVMRSEGQ